MEEQTDLFGIPVPSTDKVFLAFVVIHILIGVSCVIVGFVAMLAVKTSPRHRKFGSLYFWLMVAAFITIVTLSLMRWQHNIHLFTIGVLAFGFAYAGKTIAKSQPKNWTRLHTICMGMSYVLLLTGFYVDNGKNLPFWRLFPQWSFYVLPSLVGMPVIIRALRKHPLNHIRSRT